MVQFSTIPDVVKRILARKMLGLPQKNAESEVSAYMEYEGESYLERLIFFIS
jgi:hypothetical protein